MAVVISMGSMDTTAVGALAVKIKRLMEMMAAMGVMEALRFSGMASMDLAAAAAEKVGELLVVPVDYSAVAVAAEVQLQAAKESSP
jgi:hypothetical protein